MKKLLKILVVAFLLIPAIAGADISSAPVQQIAAVSSGSSISVTLVGTPIKGNMMTLFMGSNDGTFVTISSIAQTGVTWQKAIQSHVQSIRGVEIWYGYVGASPSTSITATLSGTPASTLRGGVEEWSGLWTETALTNATSSNGSSAAPTTVSITPPSGSRILMIANARVTGNASAPTNSFTALTSNDPSAPASYRIVTANTSYSTAWTATNGVWETAITAFTAPPPKVTLWTQLILWTQMIIQ